MKIGVIIIGSLFWESEDTLSSGKGKQLSELEDWQDYLFKQGKYRREWRDKSFKKENANFKKISIDLPIRYAKISSSRRSTYTMVYSKQEDNFIGKAIVLVYLYNINDFDGLCSLAKELSKAEGIAKQEKEIPLTKNWGTIVLQYNPKKIESNNPILLRWKQIFKDKNNINSFKILLTDESSITNEGLLNFDWLNNDELSDFDFLLTTSIVPCISEYPSSKEIADKMLTNQYFDYFIENYNSGIRTFQDDEIIEFLPLKIKNKLKK